MFETDRVAALVARAASDGPCVLDLGAGADALDPPLLSTIHRLCVVAGPRAAQLQAAFCSIPLLRDAPCAVVLVTVGAADADAERIARRLPWPHIASIPADAYLAGDHFAARAPTMAAIDRLIRACA
jgi:hypothetical protein